MSSYLKIFRRLFNCRLVNVLVLWEQVWFLYGWLKIDHACLHVWLLNGKYLKFKIFHHFNNSSQIPISEITLGDLLFDILFNWFYCLFSFIFWLWFQSKFSLRKSTKKIKFNICQVQFVKYLEHFSTNFFMYIFRRFVIIFFFDGFEDNLKTFFYSIPNFM
jgi:hypothetical protein